MPRLPEAHPILFAHRGARAHARENTLEAFVLGLAMGANGLETDAWLTRDGVVVLDHDGETPDGTPIAHVDRVDLPPHIPSLDDVYRRCGTDAEMSIDIKDPEVVGPLGEVACAHRADHRLWICDPYWRRLASWRPLLGRARLVNSTMVGYMSGGVEGRSASLREAGIDAINLHHTEWNPERVAVCSAQELVMFGWDAQEAAEIEHLLQIGIHGVFSDHVDRMVDVANR